MSDRWEWELGPDDTYVVNSMRYNIDNILLNDGGGVTRWCRLVHLKVNILLWRVLLNMILTLVNLVARNVDIPSILCPSCDLHVEDSHHVFVYCEVVKNVWRRVFKWLDLPFPLFNNVDELCSWVDSNTCCSQRRRRWRSLFLQRFGCFEM